MASKKDKFKKEVKKTLGQESTQMDEEQSMGGIVGEIAGRRKSGEKARNEADGRETDSSAKVEGSEATETEPVTEDSQMNPAAVGDQQSAGGPTPDSKGRGGAAAKSQAGQSHGSGSENAETEAVGSGGPNPAEIGSRADSTEQLAENEDVATTESRSERIDSTGQRKKTGARPMARKRDSIYNVSSDIRLEDYTEADKQRSNSSLFKMLGIAAVIVMLGFFIWQAATWLLAPAYKLAVANQEITSGNIDQFIGAQSGRLSATAPVHIRFQWEPGELQTDYLKILVERDEAGAYMEEAVLGRRPPRTASYIYFMGPLDSGKYRIQVMDASGSVLSNREVELQ